MKTRFITGIFIAVVLVGVLILSLAVFDYTFDIFTLILMLVGAYEMCKAISNKFAKPIEPVVYLAIIFAFAAFITMRILGLNDFEVLAFVGVLAFMVIVAAICVSFDSSKSVQNVITTVFVLIYPVAVLVFMLALNSIESEAHRAASLVLLFLVSPLTDVFAYLVGSTLKGPKLCPRISPKKTVSGAVGGLLGGVLGGVIVAIMIMSGSFEFLGLTEFSSDYFSHLIFLGILGSVFTQAGDLLASLIKRKVGIKDYGKIMPGHGGVLDRFDGVMFNAFVISIYMMFLLTFTV